jgi:hypothetical protein
MLHEPSATCKKQTPQLQQLPHPTTTSCPMPPVKPQEMSHTMPPVDHPLRVRSSLDSSKMSLDDVAYVPKAS